VDSHLSSAANYEWIQKWIMDEARLQAILSLLSRPSFGQRLGILRIDGLCNVAEHWGSQDGSFEVSVRTVLLAVQ
jgi:hypothetical protein